MSKVRSVVLVALLAVTGIVWIGAAPPAAAAPCPDVQVIFARGTGEAPRPVGHTGKSFATALMAGLPGRSVGIHGINYAASGDYGNLLNFIKSVRDGVEGTQARIHKVINACPSTKIVLGGFSQGAAIVGYALSSQIRLPAELALAQGAMPRPMPAHFADHVAAIVLFAAPSNNWLRSIGAPPITISPAYSAKTTRYCLPLDNICDGSTFGPPNPVHTIYPLAGPTASGATFALSRI
ncbi:MAG: cutinase family protein [Gordonia sp. (in: high G+C Gram-positive bacteria)]